MDIIEHGIWVGGSTTPNTHAQSIEAFNAAKRKGPEEYQHVMLRCPWCGSEKIALLLSGMPVFIPELENALDGGGIAIGSLKSGRDEPAWQCTDCCAQFFRESPDSALPS